MLHLVIEMFNVHTEDDSPPPEDEPPFKSKDEWEAEGMFANMGAAEISLDSETLVPKISLPCNSNDCYLRIYLVRHQEHQQRTIKEILKAHHKSMDPNALHSDDEAWDSGDIPQSKADANCTHRAYATIKDSPVVSSLITINKLDKISFSDTK